MLAEASKRQFVAVLLRTGRLLDLETGAFTGLKNAAKVFWGKRETGCRSLAVNQMCETQFQAVSRKRNPMEASGCERLWQERSQMG
jgi:hypothetical protein